MSNYAIRVLESEYAKLMRDRASDAKELKNMRDQLKAYEGRIENIDKALACIEKTLGELNK